jgi:hypothetical protein
MRVSAFLTLTCAAATGLAGIFALGYFIDSKVARSKFSIELAKFNEDIKDGIGLEPLGDEHVVAKAKNRAENSERMAKGAGYATAGAAGLTIGFGLFALASKACDEKKESRRNRHPREITGAGQDIPTETVLQLGINL